MTDYSECAKVYHAAIREILMNEWDPIGVSHIPEAQDEDDSYVGDVYRLLITHANRHELFFHLWQIETDRMGLSGTRQRDHGGVSRGNLVRLHRAFPAIQCYPA
jgi:hypothetical protein